MSVTQNGTVWEKLGAAEGLWAAALLGIQAWLVTASTVDLAGTDAAFATALVADRMRWEWITFLRVVGGLMLIWFMGSLAGRLRLAEGEPGRLATIALGVGVVWGAVWLLAGLFNSASILLATDYADPAGARIAGVLAVETVYVLTPSLVFVLMLATSLVTLRHGGVPKWYAMATAGGAVLALALAVADWYGSGSMSVPILALGLVWLAVTSAVLIPTYRVDDAVHGTLAVASR